MTASDYPPYDVPITVAVAQEGAGGVLFHVSDIYTATLDANDLPIPGLAGAKVRVENEDLPAISEEGTTDANGELLFEDLPAGSYRVRASAPDHHDATARVRIKPGVTAAEEIFVVNNLIFIEWSVREIELEDRYDFVLTATYETQVPVAVVVLEPASVSVPSLRKGDILYGELTATNYGLVRADDVRLRPPASNEFLRYEFMATLPDQLQATQRVTIPYRITALRDFSPGADGNASGGGCGGAAVCVVHNSKCANGAVVAGGSCATFTSGGSCPPGSGGGDMCCPPGSTNCAHCALPVQGFTVAIQQPICDPCTTRCCPGAGAGGGGGGGGGGFGGGGFGDGP